MACAAIEIRRRSRAFASWGFGFGRAMQGNQRQVNAGGALANKTRLRSLYMIESVGEESPRGSPRQLF